MTSISTSKRTVYRHPKAVVSIADTLSTGEFVVVPYLYAEMLRLAVAPEIEQCRLSYTYGKILREGAAGPGPSTYAPKDLNGKFVKVVISDTVHEDDSDVSDETITWHGIIEYDERNTAGTTPDPENTPQGEQQVMAYGLLRMADKRPVNFSYVDTDGTEANKYHSLTGIVFNTDQQGQYARSGNRSTNRLKDADDADTKYVFSWDQRGQQEWTAFTAVEYLLEYHAPWAADGTVPNRWRFADDVDVDYLDWWQVNQPTDGMTLKALLDALIPRFRGVGYWVDFDTSTNEIVVHVFTFNKTDLLLPNGQTLKANANQRSLDFEHAFDITQASVRNATTQRYHRVIARGARRTTTFTTRIAAALGTTSEITRPAWSTDDEAEYKAGASTASDYSGLSLTQRQNRNAIARNSDRLNEVFRRFVLNTHVAADKRWNGKIPHPHKLLDSPEYWLRGDQTAETYTALVDEEGDWDGRDLVPLLRVMRGLPLYERHNYSGTALADFVYAAAFTSQVHPSFIPLLAYARTYAGNGDAADGEAVNLHRYEMLDRLHQKSFDSKSNRDWSCRVNVVDTEPGFELIADVPHFIGGPTAGEGTGWADTADSQKSRLHGGLDYKDMWVTLCVELTERVEQSAVLNEAPAGVAEEILLIEVPNARFDYVIPHTTVEIRDGLPIETTSGGAAKDDRMRLKSIATAAAQWYSTTRQSLDLQWQQIRATFQLGWLITDVGGRYQLADVNTPITAIVYNLGGSHAPGTTQTGNTHIETSFTNLDFQ